MRMIWSAAVIAAAIFVYWRWARPALHDRAALKSFYDRADGFWARLVGCRTYIVTIGGAMALELVNALPDIVSALAGVDLTAFGASPEAAKRIGQLLLLAAAVFRSKAGAAPAAPAEPAGRE